MPGTQLERTHLHRRYTDSTEYSTENRSMGNSMICTGDKRRDYRPYVRTRQLVKLHERAVKQGHHIDMFIERIIAQLAVTIDTGSFHHSLLLLQRKCIAEGVREMFMLFAYLKYIQIYRRCRHEGLRVRRLTSHDYLTFNNRTTTIAANVTNLYRGYHRHC